MMTRKDFNAIADVLQAQWSIASGFDAKVSVWETTLSIADVFAQSNYRFDRARFYVAVFGVGDPQMAHPA